MAQGPQKPDHGGNFYQTPRRVIDSLAWRHASHRARSVLSVFQARHTGFNNGRIVMSLTELCAAMGDQNRGANARAIVELIELGFLECTTGADHSQARAREYRLTFISSGDGKAQSPATHEYRDWRPRTCKTRKIGGAEIAPRKAVRGEDIAPRMQKSGEDSAPVPTVNRDFCIPPSGEDSAPLLYNHSPGQICRSGDHVKVIGSSSKSRAAEPIGVPLDELRQWTKEVVRQNGYGGQSKLAKDSGVPDPVLSRFRSGKSLPERYRMDLQTACGRALPYVKWRAAA